MACYPTAAWIAMPAFMRSRGSVPAVRLQAKLRNLARQIWGRLTRTDESGYFSHLVNTMTDAFAESHKATALMMAAIFVMAAAFSI